MFVSFWLGSSFHVVASLVEVHCRCGSLAICGCCGEVREVEATEYIFFFSLRCVLMNNELLELLVVGCLRGLYIGKVFTWLDFGVFL